MQQVYIHLGAQDMYKAILESYRAENSKLGMDGCAQHSTSGLDEIKEFYQMSKNRGKELYGIGSLAAPASDFWSKHLILLSAKLRCWTIPMLIQLDVV